MLLNSKTINRALFLCNPGLGDHIDMIGAVRYLSRFYSEIHVPCHDWNTKTLSDFFSDNPKVKLLPINEDLYNKYWQLPKLTPQLELVEYNPSDYVSVYRCGDCKNPHNIAAPDHLIPKCFYMDLGLDLSIENSYFHIPENIRSKQLYETIKSINYIFVQQKSSSHFTSLVTWDINETFTIDPNVNLYKEDHKWHELASQFVNKPFPHYTDTIIHASELHLVNSSFNCLSSHLQVEATKFVVYHRNSGLVIPTRIFNQKNQTLPSH
jgi:hypothetical protein